MWPRAAQQLQQQGFGLIVAVVSGQQGSAGVKFSGERGVTGAARNGFGTFSCGWPGLHPQHSERDAQLTAYLGAVFTPAYRGCLQAVIDIQGFHTTFRPAGTVGYQIMQQNMRIKPAAIANDQPANMGITVKQ